MLKLKNAVNSFVLTKKKYKKRRMRGGAAEGSSEGSAVVAPPPVPPAVGAPPAASAVAAPPAARGSFLNRFRSTKKTPDQIINEKLIKTLVYAINAEYDNCLLGIDKALKNKSDPVSINTLKKGRLHIPIVIANITKAKDKFETFGSENKDLQKIITEIENKLGNLTNYQTAISQSGLDDDFPVLIKDIYTEDKIRSLSEVTKILDLFGQSNLTVALIDKTSKDAKSEYKAFLEGVSRAEKLQPTEARSSMFSFGRKPSTPVTSAPVTSAPVTSTLLNKMTFTVKTQEGCKSDGCVAKITQAGGSRKSKRTKRELSKRTRSKRARSKTLKGGRRRR